MWTPRPLPRLRPTNHSGLDASIHETRPRGLLLRLMSIFGIGKVPLTMVLMIASFAFGASGLVASILLSPILPEVLTAPVVLTAAFACCFFGTGSLAELINRYMPTMETYTYSLAQCVGTAAKVSLSVSESGGRISFVDPGGTRRMARARTESGTLDTGVPVVILSVKDGVAEVESYRPELS